MTSRQAAGKKRQRTESFEPQTPNKRWAPANREQQFSSPLSPEARERRIKAIQDALDSAPSTPLRHPQSSREQASRNQLRGTSPVGAQRGIPFQNMIRQPPVQPYNPIPNNEMDEEDEFWLEPSYIPRAAPKKSISSAGFRAESSRNVAHIAPEGSDDELYLNKIPTPPRSSPTADAYIDYPSSTAQVSDLLRQSPEFDASQRELGTFSDHEIPQTPTHDRTAHRRGSSTPGPSSPPESINTGTLRELLKRLPEIEDIPDEIDKLNRRLKAAEASAQRKQTRIHELEAELNSLRLKYRLVQTDNEGLRTRR